MEKLLDQNHSLQDLSMVRNYEISWTDWDGYYVDFLGAKLLYDLLSYIYYSRYNYKHCFFLSNLEMFMLILLVLPRQSGTKYKWY